MASKVGIKGVRKITAADELAITKTLHKRATKLWRDATKAALRAVVESDLPTVYTGMSRGSLLPLARAVRMFTVVNSTINPVVDYKKGPQGDQSKAAGIAFGQNAYILDFGTPQLPVFRFEFDIAIYQYLLHENGGGTVPAWNTLEILRETFLAYVRDNVAAVIPDYGRWLVTGRIQ